jgi:acetoin utilization deacetylase AcuC-like enzyme
MRVFTAQACLTHNPGGGHPDQAARLVAVLAALHGAPGVVLTESPAAPIEALLRRHDRTYLDRVARMSAAGGGELGPDTTIDLNSWTATLAASGAALAALDHAVGRLGHAFAAIRPPGHHALPGRAMGFCIVNHIAVVAAAARARGAERVLIVDWDVHHGNGTQAMVEHEPRTRFVSMHQWPWYPGSGTAAERGVGNCFNIPMAAGLPPAVYVESLWRGVERATSDWQPDVVLISAGYDAMKGDPLGGFTLEPEHYAEWVRRMRERFAEAPIVALMEGGYAPERLATGVVATIGALDD